MKNMKSEDIYKEFSTLFLDENGVYIMVFNDYGDSYIPSYLGTEEDRTYLAEQETGNIGTISIGKDNDEVKIIVSKDSDGKNRKRYEFLVRCLKTIFGSSIRPQTAKKDDGEYSTCIDLNIPNISKNLEELVNKGYFEETGFNIVTLKGEVEKSFDHYVENVSKGYLDNEPMEEEPIISQHRM